LRYIKNKEISIEAIKKWSIQILRGLSYLHSRTPPIIHKDLKCSNLFIDGVISSIRIGDLGLASHVNKNSIISGTLDHMAPETLDSNVYNEKTDMYAFGMCLLELLTRKSPYSECSNTREFLSKVLNVS
jgi:probable serine/threonine-protein kinase WNK2